MQGVFSQLDCELDFPVVPKYQRSPKRGQLCFELLMREYIHLWLKHNKISQQFYCKAKQELDELKKTRYAKTVAAQKPVSIIF